jgi:KUP system potassium uptake protein
VDYTSPELRSQIYIGCVNWVMLLAVVFIIHQFKSSENLAAAYGLAVTGTMTLTGVMMTWIFYLRGAIFRSALSFAVTIVNLAFFVSNSCKIPHGGYWSIIIAMFPFALIVLYLKGQKRLYSKLDLMDAGKFIENYKMLYDETCRIPGTALYFLRYTGKIHPYIVQTMFTNNIVYENNILVNIIRRPDPFGIAGYCKETLAPGLTVFEIQTGYMEMVDVDRILRENGIEEKAIFYGIEDIVTDSVIWHAFAFLKQNTPRFVQFYKLPAFKLHGIITRVYM